MADKASPSAALPVHEYCNDLELKAGQLAALTAFLVCGELHHMADETQSSVLDVVANLAHEVDALARVVGLVARGEVQHG
jgi:hypothetical protein